MNGDVNLEKGFKATKTALNKVTTKTPEKEYFRTW